MVLFETFDTSYFLRPLTHRAFYDIRDIVLFKTLEMCFLRHLRHRALKDIAHSAFYDV